MRGKGRVTDTKWTRDRHAEGSKTKKKRDSEVEKQRDIETEAERK